jgi:hypothetical protein
LPWAGPPSFVIWARSVGAISVLEKRFKEIAAISIADKSPGNGELDADRSLTRKPPIKDRLRLPDFTILSICQPRLRVAILRARMGWAYRRHGKINCISRQYFRSPVSVQCLELFKIL